MAAGNISFASLYRNFPFSPFILRTKIQIPKPSNFKPVKSRSLITSGTSISWDDVLRITQTDGDNDAADLQGYVQKVRICNRGSEMQSEFVPFMIEDHVAGYIHNRFSDHLRKFSDVFTFSPSNSQTNCAGGNITLHPSLKTPEDRTRAVGDVIKCLGEVIPGIRNELYPVISSFGLPVFFSLERAAAPYFGIKAYGVHMNGYVNRGGQEFLWIGKRSDLKPTFPGMLDHLVAGGLPHGISCKENILKECEEEAGIPRSISTGWVYYRNEPYYNAAGKNPPVVQNQDIYPFLGPIQTVLHGSSRAVPVGAVSYMDINGYSFKRDVLFCYDLELPDGFVPTNQDGEVDSFRLIPVEHVAKIIWKTEFFKPNCCLVIIDFLFRHGYISPEERGYLQLLLSLRSGDCS